MRIRITAIASIAALGLFAVPAMAQMQSSGAVQTAAASTASAPMVEI